MKRGTPQHPKTLDLAAKLGIERWAAVGILESLWHFAANYAKAGDIGRHSDAAIAAGIGWLGDSQQLASALLATGWLDACKCHRLRVHDWPDHADQTVGRSEEVKRRGFLKCYGDASSVLVCNSSDASQPTPSLALPTPKPLSMRAARAVKGRTDPPESWPEPLRLPLIARVWRTRPWLLMPDSPKPHCTRSFIYAEAEKCLDWHRKEGRRCADWVAAAANWIAKADGDRWPEGIPRATAFHSLALENPGRYLPRELQANGDAAHA